MIEHLGTLYTFGKLAYGYYKDGKEYFEAVKGGYDAVKSIKDHFEVKEGTPKLVDFGWPEKSGFTAKARDDGYEIAWSKPDKIASRELDGWEVMYEIEKSAKAKRKLVLYDGLTLIGKKVQE